MKTYDLESGSAWTCPYCGHDTTLSHSDFEKVSDSFDPEDADYKHGYRVMYIVCPNVACKKAFLEFGFTDRYLKDGAWFGKLRNSWQLLPPSIAKPMPECVPPLSLRTMLKLA